MSVRYSVNALSLIAAGFLAVATQSFGDTPVRWLGFAVSTGVLIAALAGVVASRLQRAGIGFGVLGVIAGWSLIAALVFSAPALGWIVLGDALAVAVVALTNLTVHEVTTERVVHTLDVRESELQTERSFA